MHIAPTVTIGDNTVSCEELRFSFAKFGESLTDAEMVRATEIYICTRTCKMVAINQIN
eukprot:SAG11_NODE_3593_length_2349_cov_2.378222_2_plen_58_part_00